MEGAVKAKPVTRPHPPGKRDVEVEDVAPLEEKGALLREEELERREGHRRWVGLYLAEVGVERGREREVGGQAVLDVGPCSTEERAARVERIADRDGRVREPRERVGLHLESTRRREVDEAAQRAEARYEGRVIRRHR